ncbi:heme-containing dehydratase protein [Dactylonectria macrodidyma]|uniref:Heme-containing dehydratase protein n=1 Tax=Dactylonectria macrodidyma TaxID=307937 RepID=A0A9P9JSC1_9HYPO|nr:heme-containing dehydratase protein [Dactylonectria macrodidyma]
MLSGNSKFQPGDKFIYGIFGIQYQGEEPSGRPAELIKDAGVWRETLTVSSSRMQNAVSREHKYGINGLDDMEMFTEKIGYWGCPRDRIHESSPDEQFTSPLENMPHSVPETETIRSGRTVITDLPDSICFLVEGQDHSLTTPVERTHWFDEFDDLVTGWMQDFGEDTIENGLLSVRIGYVPGNGKSKGTQPVNLAHNRKIELFYWLDMKKFERIGRVHRGHQKIRKKFMDDYCPVGRMGNGIRKITLWEETSIMKGGQIQAEYVGCREGTAFMAYDKSGVIKSKTVS